MPDIVAHAGSFNLDTGAPIVERFKDNGDGTWSRVTSSGGSSGSTTIVGSVASGATDSGNPVKVGGLYKLVRTPLTDGQRGDLSLTNDFELRVYNRALQTSIDAVQVQGVPGTVLDTNARLVDGFGGVAIGSYTPGGTATAAANVAGINTKPLALLAANTLVNASPGNSLDFDVSRFLSLQLLITTTTVVGAGTLTFTLSTKGADGNYNPLFVTTALGAAAVVTLSLGRGMPTVPTPGTPQAAGTYSWAAEIGSTVRLGIVLAGTSVNCGYSLIAKM